MGGHLNFRELAWMTFLYKVITHYDEAYMALAREREFLDRLRTKVNTVQPEDMQRKLLTGFLNRWRCRIPANARTANAVKSCLTDLGEVLRCIAEDELITIDMESRVEVSGALITKGEAIAGAYSGIREIPRFGPTSTSKLLHILNPSLFVMWDDPIMEWYHGDGARDSGPGYASFLQQMNVMGRSVSWDFIDKYPHEGQPHLFLSKKLGYDPPKPLAKFLDEYNWVSITNEAKEYVPPPEWLVQLL